MHVVVVTLALAAFVLFVILYCMYGVGKDGHLLSLSMVVSTYKPLGGFFLNVMNLLLFMCLYPEYEHYAWIHWILGELIICYNTDEHECLHTGFFWILTVLDIMIVINLTLNHKMLYFAVPLIIVVSIFAIFIVFNVLAYGVFTYCEKNSDNPLMHTIQSILELSFLATIVFFFVTYYYKDLYPLGSLCKIPP